MNSSFRDWRDWMYLSMYFTRQIMFEVLHKEIKKLKGSGRVNGISGKLKVACDLISILRCVKYWHSKLRKANSDEERSFMYQNRPSKSHQLLLGQGVQIELYNITNSDI